MAGSDSETLSVQCPSARPDLPDSAVFGVVGEADGRAVINYLAEPLPVTDDLLRLAGPASPTEVFRIAAPCAGAGCRHFDGANCRLVTRVVQLLPLVSETLPPCPLRPECRWWQQAGKHACQRCPQIVSETLTSSDVLQQVAIPDISPALPAASRS